MKKESILNLIATHGYNVGFGAKKHFATFDIIEKVPGWIGFISIAYGIISLKYSDSFFSEHVPCFLTVFGVASLYISFYLHKKDDYEDVGKQLTSIYFKLQSLYLGVKEATADNFDEELKLVETLMDEYRKISITKQVCFADWYAHYKFFAQMQIGWIDEQKGFKLFRDKIPLSFMIVVSLVLITLVACTLQNCEWLSTIGQ